MALVIASTTDSQEQVNQAAGITTPQPPSEAPEKGEPEAPQEPEPAETDPDQDEEQDDPEDSHKPKRRWGAQERISRLTREKYQYQARTQELERRLAELSAARPERPSPAQQPPQQQYTGRPQESQFERYEDYIEALTDFKAAQAAMQLYQMQQQRQAQYAQAQQHTVWQDRVAQFRETTPDFDAVLEDAEHIQLSPVLQQALLEHEDGARLAYELAKDHQTLERISRLSHTAAVRELGKFEARILNGEQAKPPAVSKAPPPISPVGQGSTRSTKSPDDMDYQEYKRWRLKNGAR